MSWLSKVVVPGLLCCHFGGALSSSSPFLPDNGTFSGFDADTHQARDLNPNSPVDWRHIVARVDQYVRSVQSRVASTFNPDSDGAPPTVQDANPPVYPTGLDNDLDGNLPHMLSLPSYGNWSGDRWQLRLRGSVYKRPSISNRTIDRLARLFFLDSFLHTLSPREYSHLVTMVQGLFMLNQRNVDVSFKLKPVSLERFPGQQSDLFWYPPTGESVISAPYATNFEGDFDFFIPVPKDSNSLFLPGDSTQRIQVIDVHTNLTNTGNSLTYLVPTTGHTLVSDIDDVLRVSTIYQPREGLKNLLTRPFYPWLNMPEIFARWARRPDIHFHYLTTAPKQMAQSYMDFVFDYYPPGSYDGRIVNISNVRGSFYIRKYLLERIIHTFPNRTFTLLGDSSNFDIMEDFPRLAMEFPDQITCLLVRNTTATDLGHWVPYNTKWFRGLDQSMYMFFRVPDDLMGLDIASGDCYNTSVPQNLTFGWQGYPFSP
ncbi:hypothetical protein VTO42DRAFT_5127 [Malbranchea cinnamomea]